MVPSCMLPQSVLVETSVLLWPRGLRFWWTNEELNSALSFLSAGYRFVNNLLPAQIWAITTRASRMPRCYSSQWRCRTYGLTERFTQRQDSCELLTGDGGVESDAGKLLARESSSADCTNIYPG